MRVGTLPMQPGVAQNDRQPIIASLRGKSNVENLLPSRRMSVRQDAQGTHERALDGVSEDGSAPAQLLTGMTQGLCFPHLQQK